MEVDEYISSYERATEQVERNYIKELQAKNKKLAEKLTKTVQAGNILETRFDLQPFESRLVRLLQ
ncbi:unnamed protein product, partial [Allacma fusca]